MSTPPKMTADLDQTDIDIVAELSMDGRCPYREIARKLGISEGTVRSRVARMQEAGYIRILAVGSPSAMGIAINAMVLVRVKPHAIPDAAQKLAALYHVRYVGVTLGSADIIVQTLHNSIEELYRFVSQTMIEMIPDLISTETLQIAKVLKSNWDWADWFSKGLAPPGALETRSQTAQSAVSLPDESTADTAQ